MWIGLNNKFLLINAIYLFVASFQTGCFNRNVEIGDKPIVVVNGDKLDTKEFASTLAYKLKEFDVMSVKDTHNVNRIKNEIVNDFIVESLTKKWAKDQGIFINREELDNETNSIRKQYPDDLSFRKALSDQSVSFINWQDKLKYSLLQKRILNLLNKDTPQPTEAQIKAYYESHKEEFQIGEQVRIRQVVLDSENNAKRIYDELRHGKSLKDLATKFSITPEGSKGGDMGWVDRSSLEVFDPAFSMRIGQRSEVVKSAYGYHIFEVIDKRKASTEPLKSCENKIKRQLREKSELQVYTQWLEKQVRSSHVFKDDQLIQALTVETKNE